MTTTWNKKTTVDAASIGWALVFLTGCSAATFNLDDAGTEGGAGATMEDSGSGAGGTAGTPSMNGGAAGTGGTAGADAATVVMPEGGDGGTSGSAGAGNAGTAGTAGVAGAAGVDAGTDAPVLPPSLCPASVTFHCSANAATDLNTGLVWTRDVGGALTFDEAVVYCATLTTAGVQWRLPTRDELLSLVDPAFTPQLDPAAFPEVPDPIKFWAGTTMCGSATSAWGVRFDTGAPSCNEQFLRHNVRCVGDE